MFNFMLDTAASSISEKLAIGGEVTILGMGAVFSILIIIWMMVEFLHLLLGEKTRKDVTNETPAAASTAVSAPQIKEEPVVPQTGSESAVPDYELIAVITAAVAAASGSAPTSFRVVSFKRANNKFSSGR